MEDELFSFIYCAKVTNFLIEKRCLECDCGNKSFLDIYFQDYKRGSYQYENMWWPTPVCCVKYYETFWKLVQEAEEEQEEEEKPKYTVLMIGISEAETKGNILEIYEHLKGKTWDCVVGRKNEKFNCTHRRDEITDVINEYEDVVRYLQDKDK
jgi:hypothetical protein